MTDDPTRDAQVRMWTIGNYPAIAQHLLPISEDTVAALDLAAGQRVLDVAVGDGNAAILAAQRGAVVTGIDLAPAQLDRARDRCAAEGVTVELRQGDAAALDVADCEYDRVVSVMGMIFAPDHAAATREMARACRPGGRVAVTSWAYDDEGWGATWRAKVADLAPDQPASPAQEWGDPDVMRQRFEAAGLDAIVERREFHWRFPSAEVGVETFVTDAGPFVLFMEAMQQAGRAEEARARLLEAMEEVNTATDGTCSLPAPYLLATATR